VKGVVPVSVAVTLSASEPKRARLDGAALRSAEQLRGELATLVFTPDRLVVVKGGPAARRAYVDRSLGRLYPARAHISLDYAAAVGQRNAALRRVAHGASDRDVLAPWTAQVADLGAMLTAARRDVIELLQPGFAERAAELGLDGGLLGYDAEPPTIGLLEERLARDIERGTTGAGPHLDEIAIRSHDRDLRMFGSQGEQRLAVLALLLAEAELITSRRRVSPLLLLDDALSELDERRRRILSERIGAVGQAIVTATGSEALPLAPAQLLRVTPGRVEIG
jgi:DNA replication and repair protein RecF